LLNEGLPFNTIYKELNSKPFEMIAPYLKDRDGKSKINLHESQEKKDYSFIPDYEEFHNDTREIPF